MFPVGIEEENLCHIMSNCCKQIATLAYNKHINNNKHILFTQETDCYLGKNALLLEGGGCVLEFLKYHIICCNVLVWSLKIFLHLKQIHEGGQHSTPLFLKTALEVGCAGNDT